MKNIFLESHNIKNPFFGFGQFNFHLINSLSKIDEDDLKFTVHAKDLEVLKNEFGQKFNYKKYHSFSRYPFLRINKKYDLWHSLNQNTKIEPKSKIPYILTVHDVHFVHENAEDKERMKRFREKLERASALVYISNFAKKSTHKHFVVPNIPEYVIYNGNTIIETSIPKEFSPSIVPTKPYLFTIGEFTARKNFHTLIEMLRFLPNYQLVLAGNNDKSYFTTVKELVHKHKLENRVYFTGKISEVAKKYYLKNCSGFVFPSLREGFGIPPIEAMQYGKPVFISNNTSLPEIGLDLANYWDHYEPEYMAQIVSKGLKSYMENKNELSKKLIAHAQSFSWDKAAKEYLAVYKSVLRL